MSVKEKVKSCLRPVKQAAIIRLRKMSKCVEMMRYPLSSRNSATGCRLIAEILKAGTPAAIGKMGNIELASLIKHSNPSTSKEDWESCLNYLYVNAGVHPPSDSSFREFHREYTTALRKLDVLGVWYNPGESKIAKRFCENASFFHFWCLEPYYHTEPWSAELKGKTVLVMSPFADTISKQYAKRELVWSKFPEVMPLFDLKTIRVPLSAALAESSFESWTDCLDDLKKQMAAVDFDVALIGAGAYSLPLCVHAKGLGKVGIHLGGSTQILFGVIGDRWVEHPIISGFFNEHWCRPNADESPSARTLVEGGCYW